MKKWMVLLLTALLTFALSACNSNSDKASGTGSKKKHYVFGYTSMTQNNPYFQVVEKAIRKKVEANGDKLITTNPAMDQEKQINQIEDLISQGVDAIFLNPVDWEGIQPALVELKNANIPIINFDAEVKDQSIVTSYVGSDNKNAGKVDGEDLVKRFPNGGKIVVLDSPTMNSVNDRISGFMEAIKGHNFSIVAQQDAKGDLQTAMNKMADILQSHSDIIAVMGGNDPTALGALAAIKAANKKDIVIYGVDGSPDAKKEIANGGPFVGTGAQSPITIGEKSVDVAYQVLKGEKVDKKYPVKTFLINKENVDQYGTDGWQ
ncbi:sugar ABC transporter substrate-binding protein [Heyndrickxia camelliae]|uniref:Sugar ABC transporter substrate-binding protein n=1 Tax=Heyndrickxia camelliae TaxID=1707093 RepID=A0A2N3LM82_9BACI|nr:sugar ABC transporter substrate-binding protein [Heyndrickxia camelliae]PKR85716.1 sugar ABC transporter substrate-binding protein [Heyndrickxia camelliae]